MPLFGRERIGQQSLSLERFQQKCVRFCARKARDNNGLEHV